MEGLGAVIEGWRDGRGGFTKIFRPVKKKSWVHLGRRWIYYFRINWWGFGFERDPATYCGNDMSSSNSVGLEVEGFDRYLFISPIRSPTRDRWTRSTRDTPCGGGSGRTCSPHIFSIAVARQDSLRVKNVPRFLRTPVIHQQHRVLDGHQSIVSPVDEEQPA